MKDFKKQIWIAPLVAAVLFFGGTRVAQTVPQTDAPLSGPLPMDSPAAQADPNLATLPDKQPPPFNPADRLPRPLAEREVGYDLSTGKTEVKPARSGPPEAVVSPSYPGIDDDWEAPLPDSVIGSDNRVQITSTTSFPYRAVTKLSMTFPNGGGGGCSGILIAAKYVLTAGHCIYDRNSGGYATSIQVIPGLSGTYQPYGSYYATYIRTWSGWVNSSDPNYDMALLTINSSVGNTTGWLGYAYLSSIVGTTGHIAGYPGDKGGSTMWYDNDPIASSSTYRVTYNIDTYGGQSGSGVYRISGSTYTVFATHTNGGSSNSGTRIDSSKASTLASWIASGT